MATSFRRRFAFGIVLLLLLLSVVANLLLARALYQAFAKLHVERIFPLGFVPESKPAQCNVPTRLTLSFWGDSRALLWDKSALTDVFGVCDYAHGGVTSAQLVLQLRTQTAVPTNYALVQIGINDLHPLGALAGHKATAIAQLEQNILTIRDMLLRTSDIVVLSTIFPPARPPLDRRLAWDPDTSHTVQEINEIIRRAADGRRVIVLDAYALLIGHHTFIADGLVDRDFFLHVNHEAYSRLNARLLELVRQYPVPIRN